MLWIAHTFLPTHNTAWGAKHLSLCVSNQRTSKPDWTVLPPYRNLEVCTKGDCYEYSTMNVFLWCLSQSSLKYVSPIQRIVFAKNRIILEIVTPKGKTGILTNPVEQKLILNRNSRFRVLDVEDELKAAGDETDHMIRYMCLELIGDPS